MKYFRVSLSFVRSCKISLSSVLCISLLLLLFPVVTILLLTMLFLVVLGMAIVTSPLSTIGEALDIQNDSLGSYSTSLSRTVSILSRTALFFAMYSIVFPLREIVRLAITLLLSDKTLPYLSCFILICYYLSRSYSAFTSPYQELGLMLYKQYKNPPAGTGQEAANTPIPVHVVVIPKELFDKACEQIMPIGVSVCILLLRVSLFLSFVFFVFFSMENYVTTEPPIRAVVTLLGGLLPKVTDIFNCSGHKNIEATATEEKVRYIVNNYKKNKAGHRTVSTQFDSADQIAFNLHGKTEACSETILQRKFKQL